MKKTLLLPLLLIFNACIGAPINHSLSHQGTEKKSIVSSQENGEGVGGNPEVYIAHQCLKGKSSQTCLEKLFVDERKVYIQSYQVIKLAGRGTSIEKATIQFKGDDLFLLYLDTSKLIIPLNTNIKSTKVSTDNNSALFILPIKEIGKEIIIKDKQNNVVLHYKVFRKE